MAIDSASIGAQCNESTGKALGFTEVPVSINLQPLYRLADYSFIASQKKWEQDEKDAQDQIKEFGKVSALNWQNAIPKERDQTIQIVEQLRKDAAEFARKYSGDKVAARLEWENKLADAKRKVSNINSRFASYDLRKQEIAQTTDADEKARLQRKLDEDVDSTTIEDTLPLLQKYNVKPVSVPAPVLKNIKVAKAGADNNLEIENKNVPDYVGTLSQVSASLLGLRERLKGASTEEAEALSAQGVDEPIVSAEIYTQAITDPKYRNPQTGELDVNSLMSNPLIAGVAQQFEVFNKKQAEIRRQIRNGEFGDQLREQDYPDINWRDGTTPEELMVLRSFGNLPTPTRNEDILHHGEGSQNARAAAQIATTRRGQDLDHQDKLAKLKQDEEQWKATQKGGETVKNGAMERAKRIFDELKGLADANGVISPDKLRQLNSEQLRYLGTQKTVTSATGVPRSEYEPLDVSGVEYAIQIGGDGVIRVMKPLGEKDKTLDRLDDGRFHGLWDNSKSTTLTHIATNILNDELSNAGSKELNAYMPIDVQGGETVSTNTVGGSTSTSTRTKTSSSQSGAVNLSDIPAGVKLDFKKGKYYYKGKEVITQ